MKLFINHEDNVAYLSIRDEQDVRVASTVPLGTLHLDFADDGALLGIEFLDAKTGLGPLYAEAREDS